MLLTRSASTPVNHHQQMMHCRPLDTYFVEAIEQGGLLHHGRGHKQLPAWVSGHIVGASVRCACLASLKRQSRTGNALSTG